MNMHTPQSKEGGDKQLSGFFFMLLGDPQFGMFADLSRKSDEQKAAYARQGMMIRDGPPVEGFENERRLFEQAIREANRIKPAFVVVLGDMVNKAHDQEQIADVKRVAAGLKEDIPLYWVSGNHDIAAPARAPTAEMLAKYRAEFGRDYYSFQYQGTSVLVLNTTVFDYPEHAPDELDAQMRFLDSELRSAQQRGSEHIIVIAHRPLFIRDPDEESSIWTIRKSQRWPVLSVLQQYPITAVFYGHCHWNHSLKFGDIHFVITSSVGYQLREDQSGYRLVAALPHEIKHAYYPLGAGPTRVDMHTIASWDSIPQARAGRGARVQS
ncbi:MAG: metallophosphoesterase [Chloroflexi bacterium]|nr:metallophosphoesterase [Chloroflexota bacterium]